MPTEINEADLPYWANHKTALKLWEAFQRIMKGEPEVVSKSARLTLSSVAVEAGYQRSTLSRRRFPDLVELIERSAKQKPGKSMSALFNAKAKVAKRRHEELKVAEAEKGILINQVANLTTELIKAYAELDKTKRSPDNVTPLSQQPSPDT